ncbi:hypothetical protein AAG570_007016 [Ranatra chinensis]|uniref:Reverse transcriptase domain-containing protein n=1 Tax=Ranatra chinensis TaxID=642074 RepID=A0ABD0ZJ26_9HEMI
MSVTGGTMIREVDPFNWRRATWYGGKPTPSRTRRATFLRSWPHGSVARQRQKGGKLHVPISVFSCFLFLWNLFHTTNKFHKNKKHEKTEIDGYRAAVKYFMNVRIEFHTFQPKEEKPYRVVIRGLHHTVPVELRKIELEELGFKIRNVSNVIINRHGTKIPRPPFFVDLEANENNQNIFQNPDGTWAKSDSEIANLFGTHLSNIFVPHPDNPDPIHTRTVLNDLDSPLPMSVPPPAFSPSEVKYAISKLPTKKAPGFDLITSTILRQLPKKAPIAQLPSLMSPKHRSFIVIHGSSQSPYFPIKAGVPQGSILSPLLYSVYTSDIPEHPATLVASFADDTAILSTNSDPTLASLNLQSHLTTLQMWCNNWKIREVIRLHRVRCLHHPGLNSAEGGSGGWESLPSPNDPGTVGRAAIPTSTDASTSRRRDSGYSTTARKARTSEDRYTRESAAMTAPVRPVPGLQWTTMGTVKLVQPPLVANDRASISNAISQDASSGAPRCGHPTYHNSQSVAFKLKYHNQAALAWPTLCLTRRNLYVTSTDYVDPTSLLSSPQLPSPVAVNSHLRHLASTTPVAIKEAVGTT